MAYQIRWTKWADRTLYKQVSIWLSIGQTKLLLSSLIKVYHVTDLLTNFPEMGNVLDADKGIRGVLINPYVRLSYRIQDDVIILIRFTDTRQRPT